jgi:hypothetical protein
MRRRKETVVNNTLMIFCIVATMGVSVVYGRADVAQQDQRAREDAAFKTGGLRAAATISGNYVRRIAVDVGGPASLVQFVSYSHAIIIGRPVRSVGRVVLDGTSINLFDTVNVERILKGNVASTVTVVLPGGRVSFPDGSIAELKAPDFKKPALDGLYLWFLRTAAHSVIQGNESVISNNFAFVPSYGPLGIFDMSTDLAEPASLYSTWFGRDLRIKGTTTASLLAQVDSLTSRNNWP